MLSNIPDRMSEYISIFAMAEITQKKVFINYIIS